MSGGIDWGMELLLERPERYRVKRGQTLAGIAAVFSTTPRLIAAYNHLSGPPGEGELLLLPPAQNCYSVGGGESKRLLCGSPERFCERNATECFYPGQTIVL